MVKKWTLVEEKILIENYSNCTITELMGLLKGRDADSINSKIKRMKESKKLKGSKTEETVIRAYGQRLDFNKDQERSRITKSK